MKRAKFTVAVDVERFADEARIGQETRIIRKWAERGTRPAAARGQRTASIHLPEAGKGSRFSPARPQYTDAAAPMSAQPAACWSALISFFLMSNLCGA
jgi:hypothetical protein